MIPVIDAILALLRGEVPDPVAERRRRAVDLVAEWKLSKAGDPPVWFCSRGDFAARLTQILEDPKRVVQGSYDWCTIATPLHCFLRRVPDLVARYAISVYDTGEGELGDLSTSVDSNLVRFDLPRYARGELPDHPLPGARTSVVHRSADWILMAAILDTINDAFDFEGPLDDYGAAPPITVAGARDAFEACGFYESITELTIPASMTAAQLVAHLNGERTDVLLVGDMSFFTLGLVNGGHIAPLSGPAEEDGGGVKLRWWSFGDTLDAPAEISKAPDLATLHEGYTFSSTVPVSTLRGMRAVILAKARADL